MNLKFTQYFSPWYILFFCVFLFYLFAGFYSYASDEKNDDVKITQKESAVIAFFRLAGVAPDYQAWIMNTSQYEAIETEKEKEKYLVNESLRLGQGYSTYNPSKSLLEFKTSVFARYTGSEGKTPAMFHFQFPDQSEEYIPVFDFPYGKNSIALVVNKFAEFASLPLTESQFNKVKTLMPFKDEEYTAKLTMMIRPSRADIDRPIVTRDVKQWVMLGEIAYLKCEIVDPTNLQQTKIWEYVAPWYKTEFEEKTMPDEMKYPHPYDLFKDKKE